MESGFSRSGSSGTPIYWRRIGLGSMAFRWGVDMSGSWDYIVIGAGSAGCALANRLTADPRIKVLLIEAGGSDRSMRFRVPLLGPFQAMGNPSSDWMILSEPDP